MFRLDQPVKQVARKWGIRKHKTGSKIRGNQAELEELASKDVRITPLVKKQEWRRDEIKKTKKQK